MICNVCGTDSIDPQTGKCTYCPDHLKRMKSESKASSSVTDPTADPRNDGPSSSAIEVILDLSVVEVVESLRDVTDVAELRKLRSVEIAGKNRKGVLAAIESRNDELAEEKAQA